MQMNRQIKDKILGQRLISLKNLNRQYLLVMIEMGHQNYIKLIDQYHFFSINCIVRGGFFNNYSICLFFLSKLSHIFKKKLSFSYIELFVFLIKFLVI